MSQTLAAGSGPATSRGASAASATARPRPRGPARAPRPSLRVVAAPVSERSRSLFVGGCLALLIGGLLTLLMLNIALAQGSFRLHDLTLASRLLTDQAQALNEDIAVQAAPAQLAKKAAALGMVPSGSVAFLRLSDGKILGVATPAAAPKAPTVSQTTPNRATTVSPNGATTPNPTSTAAATATSTKPSPRTATAAPTAVRTAAPTPSKTKR